MKDTPLSEAAKNGHTDIARLLIENGADVNKGWVRYKVNCKCYKYVLKGNPLSGAARNGHTDIVRLLIETELMSTKKDGYVRRINCICFKE